MSIGVGTVSAYGQGGESRTAGMSVSGQSITTSASGESFKAALRDGADQARARSQSAASQTAKGSKDDSGEDSGFMAFFKGLIDIINPLQHLPIISTIYREVTGDEISPMARIVGNTLYGGPIGTAVALADVASEETTGKDIGENVLAMVTGKDNTASDTALASAQNAQQLNAISPAGGGATQRNIIWDDAQAVADDSVPSLDSAQIAMLIPQAANSTYAKVNSGAVSAHSQNPSSRAPHSTAGRNGTEPVSTSTQPVLPNGGGTAANHRLTAAQDEAGFRSPVNPDAASSHTPFMQKAPATVPAAASPPGLIAPSVLNNLRLQQQAQKRELTPPPQIQARLAQSRQAVLSNQQPTLSDGAGQFVATTPAAGDAQPKAAAPLPAGSLGTNAPVPQQMIAQKMSEALDKYAAMKRAGLQ